MITMTNTGIGFAAADVCLPVAQVNPGAVQGSQWLSLEGHSLPRTPMTKGRFVSRQRYSA